MASHRRTRGRRTEHVVAEYLSRFWEGARVVNSSVGGSDVLGLPFSVEVKARAKFDPKSYLQQAKKHAKGGLGFAVLRLNGQGENNPEDYCALISLGDLVELLAKERPSAGIGRCVGCGQWILENRVCNVCKTLEGER